MTTVQGDELTTALIPVADRLISAVHALDPSGVRTALADAAWTAGSTLAGLQHLAVILAGMCSEDHGQVAALGWTLNPTEYRRQLLHADALTASLRAARTAATATKGD